MVNIPRIETPKWALQVLNNVYEIERKLTLHGDNGNSKRNVDKIKEALTNEGLFYEDPFGQEFKETRTDLEASISGNSTEDLVVIDVIKPIIRYGNNQLSKVVQKGIVVVKSSTEGK
jgi:hypothetical protein